eukprot:GEMP01097744.1.p1 GENE.GEMP01097744.1~~GEMP01097744.1.p1  ORF type:complete len:143 (+),score=40.77 GEMP01097744.1:121-549(+)
MMLQDSRLPIGAREVDKTNADPMIACQNLYGHWDAKDGAEPVPEGLHWIKHELAREVCAKLALPSVLAATGWMQGKRGPQRVHTGVLAYPADVEHIQQEAEELAEKRAQMRAQREDKLMRKTWKKLVVKVLAKRGVEKRWKD